MISTAASKAAGIGLSSGATLGIAAGAFAAEQLLKHYIGQGRRAADKWVQSSNGQDAFLKNVLEPASKLAQSDPDKARSYVDQAWRTYLAAADDYASKGGNNEKVIRQNLTTPQFMNTVQSLLGQNPLSEQYTSPFLGKAGSIAKGIGGSILSGVTGLGKILGTILSPRPLPTTPTTPPFAGGELPGQGGRVPASPENQGSGGSGPGTPGSGVGGFLRNNIGTIVQAGIGLGASLLGGTGDPMARRIAGKLEPRADKLLETSESSFAPAADYYRSILSGDRSRLMGAMYPEVSRIRENYQSTADNASRLMPRGGGRSAFYADLPFREQRDVSTALMSARPAAAKALTDVGSQTGDLARGLYSTSLSGFDSGLRSRADAYNRNRDLGKTIYDIMTKVKGSSGNPLLGGI